MPKFSIVTVAYNSSRTIEDAILSLRAQTYRDFEHIIIDGASTDSTMDIVNRCRRDTDIVVSESDNGIYDAMNKGLRLASGEFIGFLNSDDYLATPQALEILAGQLDRAGTDCVWGDVVHITESGRPVRYMSGAVFNPKLFRFGIMPPHPTFYARRQSIVDAGGFNPKYRIAGDFDLMIRLFQQAGFRGVYSGELITAMRIGGVSTEGLKATMLSSTEISTALRDNGIASTKALVGLRYAPKLFEKIRGMWAARLGARYAPPSP
jgi:glycosyltransferase involved in cell wall biosynthesis